MQTEKTNASTRKRAPNACTRCRQQKIRCRGGFPCDQCNKKRLECVVDDRLRKILVTKSRLSELEAKVALYEGGTSANQSSQIDAGASEPHEHSTSAAQLGNLESPSRQNPAADYIDQDVTDVDFDTDDPGPPLINDPTSQEFSLPQVPAETLANIDACPTRQSSPESELMNPLALGVSAYMPNARSVPIYLGTSSNWSFGRRVLTMAHERILGSPLSPDNLLFQGEAYDLGWDGLRGSATILKTDNAILPTADHAIYLINATKFHVGQMFHLFDEENFMQSFARFHNPSADKSGLMPLWYVHYLLILAFGKAFLARTVKGRKPPGADLFVQAMAILPDVTFLCLHPVETIEILCCATLYLHSLDFRSPAYQLIGQALRIALEHGMHTNMQSKHVAEALAQRCRKIWWTVYVLDRNLSSLMGVPSSIRDEDISAALPLYPESPCRATALDIQVKLSRVIAKISNDLYGPKGNLDMRYVSNTREALLDIARITDQLHRCFEITPEKSDFGISRLSAYLHILHHQCVILATRPLLYTFLEVRLNSGQLVQRRYNGVKALLIMCIESAFQNIRILSQLQDEGLLECFLSFDLDATFSSALVLLMAAAIDPSLLRDGNQPTEKAYQILGEMTTRGNQVAGFMLAELRQLETILKRIPPPNARRASKTDSCQPVQQHSDQYVPSVSSDGLMPPFMDCAIGDADWQYTMTTEQMIQVADSLDFEAFDWAELQ